MPGYVNRERLTKGIAYIRQTSVTFGKRLFDRLGRWWDRGIWYRVALFAAIPVVAICACCSGFTVFALSPQGQAWAAEQNATATARTAQANATATRYTFLHPVPTATPAPPTSTPHQKVTLTPTQKTGSNDAVMGAAIDAFIVKFGEPNGNSWPEAGAYSFGTWPGTNEDKLEVNTKSGRVYKIRVSNASDQYWTRSEAESICRAFLPADAYKTSQQHEAKTESGQVFRVDNFWVSPSLGTQFPASEFTDANLNPMTPGTVDMQYNVKLGDPSKVNWCDMDLGVPAYAG